MLPIPESSPSPHARHYREIRVGDTSLGTIVYDLTGGKIQPEAFAHLDPDLDASSVPRLAGWRPLFGQAGAAERHLQNQGVKAGDVFVFYGWFKRVELIKGTYRYVRSAPDLHVLFGWLQIEQRLPVNVPEEIPLWAREHPHYKEKEQHELDSVYASTRQLHLPGPEWTREHPLTKKKKYRELDSIYVATQQLHLPGIEICQPGAGLFRCFAPDLCLTAPQHSRSIWQLPRWFYPRRPHSILTYHNDLSRWKLHEHGVLLRSVGRGQEFVLDCEEYPEAIEWLAQLLDSHGTSGPSTTDVNLRAF